MIGACVAAVLAIVFVRLLDAGAEGRESLSPDHVPSDPGDEPVPMDEVGERAEVDESRRSAVDSLRMRLHGTWVPNGADATLSWVDDDGAQELAATESNRFELELGSSADGWLTISAPGFVEQTIRVTGVEPPGRRIDFELAPIVSVDVFLVGPEMGASFDWPRSMRVCAVTERPQIGTQLRGVRGGVGQPHGASRFRRLGDADLAPAAASGAAPALHLGQLDLLAADARWVVVSVGGRVCAVGEPTESPTGPRVTFVLADVEAVAGSSQLTIHTPSDAGYCAVSIHDPIGTLWSREGDERSFRFEGLEYGEYSVTASSQAYGTARFTASLSARTHEFRPFDEAPAVRLTLEFTDGVSGSPIPADQIGGTVGSHLELLPSVGGVPETYLAPNPAPLNAPGPDVLPVIAVVPGEYFVRLVDARWTSVLTPVVATQDRTVKIACRPWVERTIGIVGGSELRGAELVARDQFGGVVMRSALTRPGAFTFRLPDAPLSFAIRSAIGTELARTSLLRPVDQGGLRLGDPD